MTKKALILGATGLVGKALTSLLLDDETYNKIHILVRNHTDLINNRLVEHIIDFNQLSNHSDLFGVDHVFCCLGSTIKKAKTKEAFYRVDHDYVYEAAKLADKHQAAFLVISSIGANPNSMFYYSRVKGEIEQSLQKLTLPSLHIFQPSLLLGERKEFRFGEKIATPLSKLFLKGPLSRYKPIHVQQVAQAMIKVAKTSLKGSHIYSSEKIEKIAKEK
jgi:uncharacterized protein YbjT (DUF2867 family)